ncbi:MAG: CDGSH iron-sulfur domain-containing protein [Planctomycetes bacterium]|nr:CDGSH iron-sulfur domain-containing protein [Planctomycetota bacterium]
MADVKIRVRPNGPLLVEGSFDLLDSADAAFPPNKDKPLIALCRCGTSENAPFCDGSHNRCGFKSEPVAPSE